MALVPFSRASYQISIPEPCTQQWGHMKPTTQGRFCERCAKTIIDFSLMSDEELIRIIEKSGGNLCGRFFVHQLNRTLAPNSPHRNTLWQKIVAGLLALGTTQHAFASEKTPPTLSIIAPADTAALRHVQSQPQKPSPPQKPTSITGNVFNAETKEPLIAVVIYCDELKKGVSTDAEGNFTFVLPDTLPPQTLHFKVIYIGFETHMFTVHTSNLPASINVPLYELHTSVLGLVIVKTKKWWQFWRK
ncbi:MAG: carboxypeptidase-like regulatory domain-containing protein [Chitinophagales bacterium]|nr:carboxypeptidase-like regulatory domain-containing protein [Chitinophagales bacterium]MDW8418798.1 carboxypeptidase-like regulatory domain-containing protein [Chitinophagales bacterium]